MQPLQTDVHAMPNGTQTERVLREFVRDAVSGLVEVLSGSAPTSEVDIRFVRGADGHFCERKRAYGRVHTADALLPSVLFIFVEGADSAL
jgi:hypothetical protein